jgi:hypothetical protein
MPFLVVDLSSNLWYNTLHNEAGRSPDKPNRPSPQWSRDTPINGALARVCVPIILHTARPLVKGRKAQVASDKALMLRPVTVADTGTCDTDCL